MAAKLKVITLTLIVLILGYLSIHKINEYLMFTYQPSMKTKFVRVHNTGGYEYLGKGELYYYESFVVINAPEDSKKLKEEIDKFESTIEVSESDYEKCDNYQRRYIKESPKLTRNWKPYWGCSSEDCAYGKITCRTTIVKSTREVIYTIRPLDSSLNEISRERIVEQR